MMVDRLTVSALRGPPSNVPLQPTAEQRSAELWTTPLGSNAANPRTPRPEGGSAASTQISYHPHSGWFEEALPGRAINGEGSRGAMRTRHHFGLYVQVQLLLMTIFFFLILDATLYLSLIFDSLLDLAGSEENLLTFSTLERPSLFASHRQSRWLTPI
jgi:hypothetical protein